MLTLTSKKLLTRDVFELVFESTVTIELLAGQFFMFILPSGLRRAYSVAYSDGMSHTFIIKRLEDGKGGSKEICDFEIGTQVSIMNPLGHFTLKETNTSKLFIGTGTGFAPLYFQIRRALDSGIQARIHFIFGVRTREDIFYIEELENLKKNFSNFEFCIYLSREKIDGFESGYVTSFLTQSNTDAFEEFYICGSPALVRDAREILEQNRVTKDEVFFEQY